ncbi:uncharacterized protein LOC122404762 [Colletes gigas]|uniref:uncharacterized protein LOC122404762 n=1 Tax=Colletes gigas TaxID=935657 RepID=UPI001C9AEA25|nr:uncharacterized protein LOC122404762 [Colletes gigas]
MTKNVSVMRAAQANILRAIDHQFDAVEELRGKTVDEGLQGIAVQKQLFRDIFEERQLGNKLQFGHICENPIEWEQRFEEKDFSKNRHRGKVKWANVDGTYGEHYWDINHK